MFKNAIKKNREYVKPIVHGYKLPYSDDLQILYRSHPWTALILAERLGSAQIHVLCNLLS